MKINHRCSAGLPKIIALQEIYDRLVIKRKLPVDSKLSTQVMNQIRIKCDELYEDFKDVRQKFLHNEITYTHFRYIIEYYGHVIKTCQIIDHARLHSELIIEELNKIKSEAA